MKLKRLLRMSILLIAVGGLTACGEKKDAGSAQQENSTPHVFGQEIYLEEPLPRFVISQSVKLPVSVRNTSNFSWSPSSDHPVRLAYHWFDKDGSKIIHDGVRTLLAEDLPVGATTKLSATVVAPPTPGDYTLRLTFVQEGVAWFDDQGAKPVEVSAKVEGQ